MDYNILITSKSIGNKTILQTMFEVMILGRLRRLKFNSRKNNNLVTPYLNS